CYWCDVKESWKADLFPPVNTDQVVERALQCPANAVIVTGGEPLLYSLDYLCGQLKDEGRQTREEGRDDGYKVQGKEDRAQSTELRIADPESRIENQSIIENRTSKIVRTFLETSGSQPLSGSWDWICLSPKRDRPPRQEFYAISHELKVIIHIEEDFVWAEEQAGMMNPHAHLFLQPEWSRRVEMLPQMIKYIESHPAWRLSLQMHKYIGIP
ncbi:MAG: 7-carboxy-7-deazaguanine synthase QueE, partial [Bacteroidota bacterium]